MTGSVTAPINGPLQETRFPLIADPKVNSVRVQKQPNPSYAFTLSGGKTGRHVRIQLNGTGYLSLANVEFELLS